VGVPSEMPCNQLSNPIIIAKVIENNPEDAPLLQSYVDGAKKELEENNNKEL
jgi:hypothetical protein